MQANDKILCYKYCTINLCKVFQGPIGGRYFLPSAKERRTFHKEGIN